VHQAQFGLAITKDQLAAEACKMALRTRPHHALTRQWVAEGRAGPKGVKKLYERFDWLISERNGDPLDHQRRAVTWPTANSAFDLVEKWKTKYGATMTGDGTRKMEAWQLFNLDETCLATAPKKQPVLCTKGRPKSSSGMPVYFQHVEPASCTQSRS
jgi:hypothetical protein